MDADRKQALAALDPDQGEREEVVETLDQVVCLEGTVGDEEADTAAWDDHGLDRADADVVRPAEANDVAEVEAVDEEGDVVQHGLVGVRGVGEGVHGLAAADQGILDVTPDDEGLLLLPHQSVSGLSWGSGAARRAKRLPRRVITISAPAATSCIQ